ncbi:hypothetical protein VMCG_10190 [Cytospora schulzeri]|uniref:Uncharacterized protein n=1 Tax=Cytospora schulzeri TaxID=448051 RepID=A0A423VD55_9PEZI|nr:hypothetical protein VMCG_10190 [Valsa malicola]
MATTRHRSRSSVDHIFDLVGDLDDDQLSNLLHEINSSNETNVPVSMGVEYFEEQRRTRGPAKHALRPTPSFLNQPHEPVDWPKQKPRAVSGSQWRQSMRVASPPYGGITRHQTEPISPPLTASPPLSPPLSPPRHNKNRNNNNRGHGHESPVSPRRSVTAPMLSSSSSMEKSSRVEIESVPLGRPISPPREAEEPESQLASFSFSLDGFSAVPATPQRQSVKEEGQSPRQQQQRQQPDFSRISTMPLMGSSFQETTNTTNIIRPRTSTGDAATTANTFKPRSFRRISRPVFLSPANIPAPDALAQRLSQYLFEDPSPPFPPMSSMTSMKNSISHSRPAVQEQDDEPFSLEAMLKEPVTPRANKMVYGRVEKEVPSVGIFEVLSEG